MTCYSIGYRRDDGSFRVLATLNNNDGELEGGVDSITAHQIAIYINNVMKPIKKELLDLVGSKLEVLKREDAPDYVDLEGL